MDSGLLYDYMCYGILRVINAMTRKYKVALSTEIKIQWKIKVSRWTRVLIYALVLL